MSEHEVDYAGGECSQGCHRPATTRRVWRHDGLETSTPYCADCFEREVRAQMLVREEP